MVDALNDRKVEPVVFDSSAFPGGPGGAPITLSYERGAFRACGPCEMGPDSIAAVWQNAVVGIDLPAMAPGVRETCISAAELAVVGLLDSLPAFQLDPHASQSRAGNKPRQLRIAQQLGLEIPATIVTNDPVAVRAFARRCGPLITKMLVQPASTGPETDVLDTREVAAAGAGRSGATAGAGRGSAPRPGARPAGKTNRPSGKRRK